MLRKLFAITILSSMALAMITSCEHIDDKRIPRVEVYLPFNYESDWIIYGVAGAASSRSFIKQERIPANYPYPALSYTGYGGILLCSDVHGNPIAYDLSCPVEVSPNVRIVVDNDLMKARCPKCGSVYEIYTNYGIPVSGPALDRDYGLTRYLVADGINNTYRAVIRGNY